VRTSRKKLRLAPAAGGGRVDLAKLADSGAGQISRTDPMPGCSPSTVRSWPGNNVQIAVTPSTS